MAASSELAEAKAVVTAHHQAIDAVLASPSRGGLVSALLTNTAPDYRWRGVDPFGELAGAEAVAAGFLGPLLDAFGPVQRRPDVFLAGSNEIDGHGSVWVCQMGHLLGLFDRPWLGIPPTGRMTFHRYAEFNRMVDGRIAETALFCDVLSIMQQAGCDPLPPQTGAAFVHPGPRTNDGLLFDDQDPADGKLTLELVNRMIDDLSDLNRIAADTGVDDCPPERLAETWHHDMIWYGPAGIGSSYTIDRYQAQHQMPFRRGLTGKTFNGHVARFAEGNYACFFGWPNLTNTPSGGFLGLPATGTAADMRVVDVYRRHGDKLAENWVFIDLVHWLKMQGLDVLARLSEVRPTPPPGVAW
ncbi:MAG: ester cyclase [Actinomycetota bacterium]